MVITEEQEGNKERQPAPDVTPEPLFRVVSGFMAAKHLFVAKEVGLFEESAEGLVTLDELARRSGEPPDLGQRHGRHLLAGWHGLSAPQTRARRKEKHVGRE